MDPTIFARRYIALCIDGKHKDIDVDRYLIALALADLPVEPAPIGVVADSQAEARLYVLQCLTSGETASPHHVKTLLKCTHGQALQFMRLLKAEYNQAIQCPTFRHIG